MFDPKLARQIARYGVIGTEVVGSIGLGILGGFLLDRWLQTEPLFILVGLLLGIGLALMQIVLLIRRIEKDDQQNS